MNENELIVSHFPFQGEYIRATIYQGALRIYSCPIGLFQTEAECWRLEFIK